MIERTDRVLIIGSGGREHAIAWAIAQSPHVERVYGAPGNPGIQQFGQNVLIDLKDIDVISEFLTKEKINLTIIGPEGPLVEGLSDALREKGHLVVGASQDAAQLEGSKLFAKKFMMKYGIPTAAYETFDDAESAKKFAKSPEGQKYKILKADGLAAGKGVFVTSTTDELMAAIDTVMREKKLGSAGDRIVLEEKLEGPEVSVIALTDGNTVLPFPASQDHKRAYDGDKGPNTGGMGAYAPTPFYDDAARTATEKYIIDNFIRGVQSEGFDFRGIIYFGIMLTAEGPKVLEFNVRFGDPEAQVVLPLIESDVYKAFLSVAEGTLSRMALHKKQSAACTVVLTSKGYPGKYGTGYPITGLAECAKDSHVLVFHAGTKMEEGNIVTNGGRVLNITALGDDLEIAVVKAYQGVKKIKFQNIAFRSDIAGKALKNKTLAGQIKRMKSKHPLETS